MTEEIVQNVYGDLQVPASLVPTDPESARAFLQRVLAEAGRGVWVDLPFDSDHAGVLPVAAELGFKAHHAYKGVLTLQAWCRPRERNPTPPFGHHAVGAAALVVNADGAVLGIRERFDRTGLWHTPGGHTDEREDFITAAVREAREETGVACKPLGIVALHERHMPFVPSEAEHPSGLTPQDRARMAQSTRFGSTHVGVFVLCYAPDARLAPDPEEIAEAAWLPAVEFAAGAHEHEAALTRALLASGQLAAAAALARAEGAAAATPSAPAVGDDSPGASAGGPSGGLSDAASSARAAPDALAGWRARGTAGLLAGVTARMRHGHFKGATFPSTFYTALPMEDLVGRGLLPCPSLINVQLLTPAPERAASDQQAVPPAIPLVAASPAPATCACCPASCRPADVLTRAKAAQVCCGTSTQMARKLAETFAVTFVAFLGAGTALHICRRWFS